jgi:hypothetical protein
MSTRFDCYRVGGLLLLAMFLAPDRIYAGCGDYVQGRGPMVRRFMVATSEGRAPIPMAPCVGLQCGPQGAPWDLPVPLHVARITIELWANTSGVFPTDHYCSAFVRYPSMAPTARVFPDGIFRPPRGC